MLHTVLYFHELKNSTQRLSTKFGFRFQISRKLDLSRKVWFQFLISQRIFSKRIFSTKFGFSFPLLHKIFRLQFSLIILRKNRSEAFCVSSENILHLTCRRLLSVAFNLTLAFTNIKIRLEKTEYFPNNSQAKPLKQTAVGRSVFFFCSC